MITLEEVIVMHAISISRYGGADGVRDVDGLLAAIGRPYQTFGGEELYKDVFEQAAAAGESIIMNHPFVDGNKRTGWAIMYHLLRVADYKIDATEQSAYDFVVKLATGEFRFEEAVKWLRAHSIAVNI